MKLHKNQRLLTMSYPLERLARARSRGQTMAPEGQKPSQWLHLTELPSKMYSQPIVHKALSWGTIRRSACILAEITIRKSQAITQLRHGQLEIKIGRVTVSPGLSTYLTRTSALVHHPGITAVEHLVQVTRSRTLDGEDFLLFNNTVIGWPLDRSQHPNGYGKIRIVQATQYIGKTCRRLGFIVPEDIVLGHAVFTKRHNLRVQAT